MAAEDLFAHRKPQAAAQDLFGLGTPLPVTEDGEPAPKPARKPRRLSPAADTLGPEPDPVAAAEAAYQRRLRLETLADALVALQQRLATTPAPPAPITTAPAAPSSVDVVVARWNSAMTDPAALGLPPGSRGRAVPAGAGVAVQIKVPEGTVLPPLLQRLVNDAARRGWGEWWGGVLDSTRVQLVRDVVGEDPATPWRAAGDVAYRVYAGHQSEPGEIGTRRRVFEAVGLVVKTGDGKVRLPKVRSCEIGLRGGEILVDLPPGMSVDAAIKTAPALANIFKCPDLVVVADGVRARIKLNHQPAADFPAAVPLEPQRLWRPTTPEQRFIVAPNLVLPVGVTRHGDHITVPLAQGRPHTVITGTSGSGKSRTLQTMIVGLCLQGAQVAVGDFKGDPDLSSLYASRLPGFAHYSASLAGISRLVLWLKDEMALRSALIHHLARRGVTRPAWDPVVVIIDEWGQGCDELLNSPDPAEKGAAEAMVNAVSKLFAQGRSFGLYLCLSTQHTYASSLPGRIAQNTATRIVMGRPKAGARGPLEVLFASEREEAAEAAAGIADGMRGRGIVADQQGRIQQFQSYFGYSPADHSTVTDPELSAAWAATEAALTQVPRLPRWGWKFPTEGPGSDGSWQEWSLYPGTEKAPLRTVEGLDVIVLDGPEGEPDPEAAVWDPLSVEYSPGAAPLSDRHRPATRTQ
jgi:S-DNA-T family DNA segregation ATPase FtsK/SpoIIIE